MGSRPRLMVATGTLLVCTGCGIGLGTPAEDQPTTPAPTNSTVEEQPTLAPPSLPVSTPYTPTPPASGSALATSTRKITGSYEKASWTITVPTFSGGAAAAEVNRRVSAAVDDLIEQTKDEARDDDGERRTLDGRGAVITNDGRTAQVTITYSDYLADTAHPTDYVTTTVVDVRQIKPVRFSDVVQNPPEAMRFLATQITAIATSKGEDVTEPGGLAPKLSNWAAWQSDTKGMIFEFGDYQLGGHGLRSYTVPWSKARLILSDYGQQLLLPS